MHAEKSGMCSPNGCVHPEQGGRRVCMVSIRGSRAAPSSVHRRGRRPTVQPPQHVTSTHARCRQQAHGGVVGPEQDISVPRNTGKWGWCMKASSSLTQMHASSSSNTDAESERPPFLRERIAARPDTRGFGSPDAGFRALRPPRCRNSGFVRDTRALERETRK